MSLLLALLQSLRLGEAALFLASVALQSRLALGAPAQHSRLRPSAPRADGRRKPRAASEETPAPAEGEAAPAPAAGRQSQHNWSYSVHPQPFHFAPLLSDRALRTLATWRRRR